jgi:hypothetical protein
VSSISILPAQRHKGREFNSRPLDVDVFWLLSFKTTESEKKFDINAICGLKGREFNSRPLGHFALFCLGSGRTEKIAF